MKKLVLLLFFFTSVMKSQDNVAYKPNTEIVNAEASVIIPIGSLSNKFGYAHSYGFWFKIKEENSISVNAGFTAIILKNPRPIDYKFNDSIYSIASNKFGFDIGIRAVKMIPISISQKNYLEIGTTIGLNYLDYDFPSKKMNEEEENNSSKNETLYKNTTLILAPEIKYMYKNLGLKFQYRYTPYSINNEFETNFGSSSISFGIVYKQ